MTTPLDVVPDVKAIGKEWLAVWNERRNPDLSHKELDYFSAFLTWLHERGYLTTYRTQEKELREAIRDLAGCVSTSLELERIKSGKPGLYNSYLEKHAAVIAMCAEGK